MQEFPLYRSRERASLSRGESDENPWKSAKLRWIGLISAIALLAATAILYPAARGSKVYASQDKEAARPSAADQSTSLNDQTDLNVTVYNSNIALIRDVRISRFPAAPSA